MQVRSLGYKTDLIFAAFDGKIIDRDDYLVIRTPANPDFYWGNFLLFSHPPGKDDFSKWRKLFAREIGAAGDTQHQAFGWDSTDGDEGVIQPFLKAGFHLDRGIVLTHRLPLARPGPPRNLQIRALQSASDWEQVLDNQMACRPPEFDVAGYRSFRQRQMNRYQLMVQAGLGDWYGAFVGERLVADLGVFNSDGVGRYQSVQAHPDYRRRGFATALVAETARLALRKHKLRQLVIVADENSVAQHIYESIGFEATESQLGVAWWRNRTA